VVNINGCSVRGPFVPLFGVWPVETCNRTEVQTSKFLRPLGGKKKRKKKLVRNTELIRE
jgi:hypothetical protein